MNLSTNILAVIMSKKTQNQLNKYLQKEIRKAQFLGLSLYLINPEVRISKSKSTFGTCCKQTIRNNIVCNISLSNFTLNLKKKEIKSILMHEVLHAQINSRGHDKIWRDGCDTVRNNFSYQGYEKYHLHKHPYSKNRAKQAYRSGTFC